MFNIQKYFVFIFISLFIVSCQKDDKLKIAISKGVGSVKYEMYEKWLKNADTEIEVINLFGMSTAKAVETLKECDGLLLSGGPDVHPVFFGKPEDSSRCEIEPYRDTLEFELIKIAEKRNIPILAICRGAQILNIAHGGDLIVDILEDTQSEIPHQTAGEDIFHPIKVADSSRLYKISDAISGTVNSNHHQSVGRLADVFKVSAVSPDGIIEAYEAKDNSSPLVIAVQWHPERLENESRFSSPIAAEFIKEVRKFKHKRLNSK